MLKTHGDKRRLAVARWLLLLYVWAFPLLGFVHSDAAHHAGLPLCLGFAGEHRQPSPDGSPLIHNLHIWHGEDHCAVCALARAITLSPQTRVGELPPLSVLVQHVPALLLPGVATVTGSLGSRAPPAS